MMRHPHLPMGSKAAILTPIHLKEYSYEVTKDSSSSHIPIEVNLIVRVYMFQLFL